MNYLLGTLAVAVVILFLFAKSLYVDNQELKNAQSLIIYGYETSIEELEKKAKFEKEVQKEKEDLIRKKEKVIIENEKRGAINEDNTNSDFVITSF